MKERLHKSQNIFPSKHINNYFLHDNIWDGAVFYFKQKNIYNTIQLFCKDIQTSAMNTLSSYLPFFNLTVNKSIEWTLAFLSRFSEETTFKLHVECFICVPIYMFQNMIFSNPINDSHITSPCATAVFTPFIGFSKSTNNYGSKTPKMCPLSAHSHPVLPWQEGLLRSAHPT